MHCNRWGTAKSRVEINPIRYGTCTLWIAYRILYRTVLYFSKSTVKSTLGNTRTVRIQYHGKAPRHITIANHESGSHGSRQLLCRTADEIVKDIGRQTVALTNQSINQSIRTGNKKKKKRDRSKQERQTRKITNFNEFIITISC